MANLEEYNGRRGWQLTKTFTGAGAQEVINLPFEIRSSTIQLQSMDGTAKVEASIDDTHTEWKEWPPSFVSTTEVQAIICAVKYIRVVHGTATTSTISIWSVD
jgi:hypothetical protein